MNYKICIILSNNDAFAKAKKEEETIPFISYPYAIMRSTPPLTLNILAKSIYFTKNRRLISFFLCRLENDHHRISFFKN